MCILSYLILAFAFKFQCLHLQKNVDFPHLNISVFCMNNFILMFRNRWVVLRWQRSRTGRPLSPPQIHQKNIWMPNNYTKQFLIASRGQQPPRKAAHCLRKEVGQNIKDKKRDKRVRDGDLSQEGSREGEVSKHQETLLPVGLWGVLESQRST